MEGERERLHMLFASMMHVGGSGMRDRLHG